MSVCCPEQYVCKLYNIYSNGVQYWFAALKQFLKLIAAWAYEGHLRNALTGVATNKPLPASPISEYNPSKQYWQAGPIILYE